MSTLPQIVSPAGEVVRVITATDLLRAGGLEDLEHAEHAELGTFAENADHLVAIAREAKGLVGSEAIRRMDRTGSWTVRAAGFEFKAPSPAAGTKRMNAERLREVLDALVDAARIDQALADRALERTTPTRPVTLKDVELLETAIHPANRHGADARALLGVLRTELEGEHERQGPGTPGKAGLNALRKLGPDVAAAIDACEDDVDAPARTATIKRTRADDGTA